ncbi:MAG TPA: polyprenyl synthetase family protein [Planctomycetota bacterium]
MKVDLESALDRYLPRRGVPRLLRSAMEYTLFSAGKRLRPQLVLDVCESLGGDLRNAVPAACAVEYIHTYSLIHDDLPAMDDDDVRRGKPSSHVKFDEATAILAGDALQAAAFEAIAKVPDASLAGPLAASLARGAGAAGMVGGQVLDLAPKASLREIHLKKTAALFETSTEMGAIAAKSNRVRNLAHYGRQLGLAFQAVDDILDRDEKGRKNYAVLHGVEAARRFAAKAVGAAKGAIKFLGARGIRLSRIADFVLARTH